MPNGNGKRQALRLRLDFLYYNQCVRRMANWILWVPCLALLFILIYRQTSIFRGEERVEYSNTNTIVVKRIGANRELKGQPDEDPQPTIQELVLESKVPLPENVASPADPFPPQPLNAPSQEFCLADPPFLIGRLKMDLIDMISHFTEDDVLKSLPELKAGGEWQPENCQARHRVALVVPFRDRQKHLNMWLMHMIPILKRQLLDFRIIVAEQNGTGWFNKGKLFNAAFQYAEKLNVSCVIFHDVDLYPEDDRNLYICFDKPRHMAPYVNTLNYQLMYEELVGGVLNMRNDLYRAINGFSNKYWGWGGEDDDVGIRLLKSNFTISRPSRLVGRYSMVKHEGRRDKEGYPKRWALMNTAFDRMHIDGVSNSSEWEIIKATRRPLYHHLLIDVGLPSDEDRRLMSPTPSLAQHNTSSQSTAKA